MSDDEIFVILEKCKGDLEYATLENAVQGLVQFFYGRPGDPRPGVPWEDNPQKMTFQKSGIINQTLATEKSDSILSFLDETKSGIWNRVNFIRKVSKSEDLKISISSLATTKMHLEQFLVFEIHSYLSPG